ncbi:GDSL esterase/lipase At1g20120-like [Silene latifolia]|uniref:GDSL esterase/lipase At1g20120-like n=1 Tax=Silene latifolia TaxID=37657 RepID=UPI003D76F795
MSSVSYTEGYWSMVFQLYILVSCYTIATAKMSSVPAVFAFGDSIVDSGNNNHLPLTFIKANFPPNGKDFQGRKATGRFCNGRLPTDFLAEKLGVKKYLPAYLDNSIEEEDLVTGVSFASAGSGYDNMTASLVLTRSLEHQLEWFKEYRRKMNKIVGVERTDFIISNSVYFIVTGSCDLANTYFTFPFRRMFQDADSYTDTMLHGANTFVKLLYEMGARKIAVSNVPPLGYLPIQRTLRGGLTRQCPQYSNAAVQLFNNKLESSLRNLSAQLHDSSLLYLDTYNFFLDLVVNSTKYGFEVVDRGCCGSGLVEAGPLCNVFSLTCKRKYLFWDSFHPSEAAYELIASRTIETYFPHFS